MAAEKLNRLKELLRSYGSCLVAYSGGVDSVFLARVAYEVLGERALAVIADSPSLPRRELAEALAIGVEFKFPVKVVRTQEFANAEYLANPTNRCYFCKHELFTELVPLARTGGFAVIAYGENASDVADFRPGAKAAAEFQVRAPLKEAGLTKAEIREFSAQLGLPTADKPQMACLSSRIPHGEAVSPEKLRMIEAAEQVLRDLGFYDVRVRHHKLDGKNDQFPITNAKLPETGGRAVMVEGQTEIANRQPPIGDGAWGEVGIANSQSPIASSQATPINGRAMIAKAHGPAKALQLETSNFKLGTPCLARIEVGVTELPRLLEAGMAARVAAALKAIGYAQVTVDLQGYRRGGGRELAGKADLAAKAPV